jgi:two-component system phosphate regulon sensor histidine kinase PhoR
MQKFRWLPILMVITILGITGFQGYWLKNNYDREERTMQIKANVAFQETVRQLQTAKLKLKDPFFDSTHTGKTRIFINEDFPHQRMKTKVLPRQEIVTMVNSMRDKLRDSLSKETSINSSVIISTNKDLKQMQQDSLPMRFERRGDDRIFQVLYGIDSLQDSLHVPEITKAYTKKMVEEKINVPFIIHRLDSTKLNEEPDDMSEVTVGFVHPITYRLELGNTFPYLVKKLTLPVLFSIFLVGFTILSFVLLYRNLLRQRRLTELKNDFISNITHELKTPIATVGVAIEALKNFNAIQDPQRTKEYLDISQNELQRLSLLVDKVLKLSLFERKELELKKEQFDCKLLVEEVINSMKLQFEKYHAKVELHTEGDNFIVEADKLHITSVIYNLLDNALKYSSENPVIDIWLRAQPENIEFSVSDNGVGIEAAYKGKIFDKFFRVPMGNKHNIKGYGLGLSYVSEVIKRHKGNIYVESELGKGSIFTAKFPYTG